jgi:hypothetical protein
MYDLAGKVALVTGVHGFVFEPLTDLDVIIEKYGQAHVIVGKADIRVLLTGTQDDVRAKVERCMSRGRDCSPSLSHTCPVPSPVPRTGSTGRGSRCRVSSGRWR